MKVSYNSRTKKFSLLNLTEDEANAILRSLAIIAEKIWITMKNWDFNVDNGDCFSMPTESYEAASKLYNELQGK